MASRLHFIDEVPSLVDDFDFNAPESNPTCNQGSDQSLSWTTPQQQSESHQSSQNNIPNQGSGLLTGGGQQFGGEITEKIIRKRQIDKKYRENRKARQQETKSNLEQLKREMQEKERQWMNNLKISEDENGRLKNEIQEKEQLCKFYQERLVALTQAMEQLVELNQINKRTLDAVKEILNCENSVFQRELPIVNQNLRTQPRELDHLGHDYDSEEQVPLFSKILNEEDLDTSLKIQINPLLWTHLDEISGGLDDFHLLVKDSTGGIWRFLCTIQKTDSIPELVCGEGWLNFVQTKRLKIDGLVVFRKERDRASEAHYRIEVKRSIILMGRLSWLDWSAD